MAIIDLDIEELRKLLSGVPGVGDAVSSVKNEAAERGFTAPSQPRPVSFNGSEGELRNLGAPQTPQVPDFAAAASGASFADAQASDRAATARTQGGAQTVEDRAPQAGLFGVDIPIVDDAIEAGSDFLEAGSDFLFGDDNPVANELGIDPGLDAIPGIGDIIEDGLDGLDGSEDTGFFSFLGDLFTDDTLGALLVGGGKLGGSLIGADAGIGAAKISADAQKEINEARIEFAKEQLAAELGFKREELDALLAKAEAENIQRAYTSALTNLARVGPEKARALQATGGLVASTVNRGRN